MLNRGLDKLELLRIVEAVANEKSIDKELVIDSMESAIQKAALTKFGNNNSIEVRIDRETGSISINKVLEFEHFACSPALRVRPRAPCSATTLSALSNPGGSHHPLASAVEPAAAAHRGDLRPHCGLQRRLRSCPTPSSP